MNSIRGGDLPLPRDTNTVAKELQNGGYVTGCFGKWGLGRLDSTGSPLKNGFDTFYGYIGHRQAHTYYPEFLYRDENIEYIEGNQNGGTEAYSHDLIMDEAFRFVESHASRPFFCYLSLTVPHFALQVPDDSLAEYIGQWNEKPYRDGGGTHPDSAVPHATYAAMITRMDRNLGELFTLLEKLRIEENTIVIFTSDNGDAFRDKTGSDLFQLTGPYRGGKGTLYEGGIRVPFIVRWPRQVETGQVTNATAHFADVFPTLCEVAGLSQPKELDGTSLVPILKNPTYQLGHRVLYWEYENLQALRAGSMKIIRKWDPNLAFSEVELYDVEADPGERSNLVFRNRDLIEGLASDLARARTVSPYFPSPFDAVEPYTFGEFETAGFGKNDPPVLKLLSGFSWQGDHHAWTVVGPETDDSVFAVRFDGVAGDVQMRLTATAFLHPVGCPVHEITVLVNGREVGGWTIDVPGQRTHSVTIPRSVLDLAQDDQQFITLRIPTATDFTAPNEPPSTGTRRALRVTTVRFLKELL